MANKSTIIKFILGVLFVLFFRMVIASRTGIANAQADMAVILTVWVALNYGSRSGVIFGFVSGIMTGLLSPMELGWSGMMLALIGFFTGNIKNKVVIELLPVQIIALMTAVFVYNILLLFFTRFNLFVTNLSFILSQAALSTLNSVIAGIIIFMIIRYRHVFRNLI